MERLRLAASLIFTLVVLGFAWLLFGPSFAMPFSGINTGMERGALPQFCVVAGSLLALLAFGKDLVSYRRNGLITGPPVLGPDVQPLRIVALGLGCFALLAAFLWGWSATAFPVAAVVFVLAGSLALLPPTHRTPKGVMLVCVFAVLFGSSVWALFVYGLKVPLR